MTKQQILQALQTWINQRPGLEFGNYGNLSSYRAELRSIAKDKRDAQVLLTAVALRDSITAQDILAATRAYSGRLQIKPTKDGGASIEYCTGQYWPTEYRKAVCAVLASVLWERKRADMPKPVYLVNGRQSMPTLALAEEYAASFRPHIVSIEERYNGERAGDWIRSSFRREYGRSIQARWFD